MTRDFSPFFFSLTAINALCSPQKRRRQFLCSVLKSFPFMKVKNDFEKWQGCRKFIRLSTDRKLKMLQFALGCVEIHILICQSENFNNHLFVK